MRTAGYAEENLRNFEDLLIKYLAQNHPDIQVEVLSNVEIADLRSPTLMSDFQKITDVPFWGSFVNASILNQDFHLEIDMILKISSLKMVNQGSNPNKSQKIYLPFDLQDQDIGYELDLKDGPLLIYFEIVNNPPQFSRKLWELEKIVFLQNISSKDREWLITKDLLETKDTQIGTWKGWLAQNCSAYYSIISNHSLNNWFEGFISKLCIYYEQSHSPDAIIFEPALEESLLKILIQVDAQGRDDKNQENDCFEDHTLSCTQVGHMLKTNKLIFLLIDATHEEQSVTMEDLQERLDTIDKNFQKQINLLQERMDTDLKNARELIASLMESVKYLKEKEKQNSL